MASYFGRTDKPEGALKRAQDLISVGNKEDALKLLHDVITAKRHHRQWQQTYEGIMLLYLELCVDLKEHRGAKDGLHQYRNMSQQHGGDSLEKVIVFYVELAERRMGEARKKADAAAVSAASATITDLENDLSSSSSSSSASSPPPSRPLTDIAGHPNSSFPRLEHLLGGPSSLIGDKDEKRGRATKGDRGGSDGGSGSMCLLSSLSTYTSSDPPIPPSLLSVPLPSTLLQDQQRRELPQQYFHHHHHQQQQEQALAGDLGSLEDGGSGREKGMGGQREGGGGGWRGGGGGGGGGWEG
ncbi:hypothetical protein VYU27_008772 [Nannochloropsis oceanica]